MDIREQLLSNFPKTIDVTKTFFKAIVSNEKRTGATEKTLQQARDYSIEYISTPEVMKQTGEMLEKTMRFLTYLPRFTNESEEGWKRRYKAIFIRGHNSTWGTPFDVKQVFKTYFPTANIFLVENTNDIESNLITNGDFLEDLSGWNYFNCELSTDARFSKKNGVDLKNSGALVTRIDNIKPKCYYLHFFMNGGVSVIIKNNNNKYWNFDTKEWQTAQYQNKYVTNKWDNKSIYFYNQSEKSTTISIEFRRNTEQETDKGYLDYVRLYEKQPYPSFSIIAQFEGTSVSNVISLVPGNRDENPEPFVENYSFFDKDALTGVATGFSQDVYQDLLDTVKPAGCKAYIEIVNKDYIEKINA